MTPKDYIKNKSFCPLPWTGFHYDPTGVVKNCIVSKSTIGNLCDQPIQQILSGTANRSIAAEMLADHQPDNCSACHRLEKHKRSFDIVSSRIYYLRELKNTDVSLYNSDDFQLQHVDVRWQNTCNFACVYCGPEYSSKWEQELKQPIRKPSTEQRQQLKTYIFDNLANLKNVYLAGGEPLLMTENEEFLTELLRVNPDVMLRVNTNLSRTGTRVYELIKRFSRVHWTVSIDSTGAEFEYIRYGSRWTDFVDNLKEINELGHLISFNMLWFILNHNSLFDCIGYLQGLGYHNNSFILGPITGPHSLDIRNLSESVLQCLEIKLRDLISRQPGYLLEDGYKILLDHLQQPFEPDLDKSLRFVQTLDQRRNLDSSKIFTDLYKIFGK